MTTNIWRIVVGTCLTAMLALLAWDFNATASIPKEYATKDEVRRVSDKNDKDHQRILDKLDTISNQIFDLHKGKK